MNLEELQMSITILHTAFFVCLAITLLFLALTIVLFVRFGMLTVFRQRLGLEVKQSIREFDEENDKTTALRFAGSLSEGYAVSSRLKSKRLAEDTAQTRLRKRGKTSGKLRAGTTGETVASGSLTKPGKAAKSLAQAPSVVAVPQGETTRVLHAGAAVAAPAVPSAQAVPVAPVTQAPPASAQGIDEVATAVGMSGALSFTIVKEVLVIYTDEAVLLQG